ncbi:MAG: hypothetical protein FWG88_04945 [Oscillospiraceae bacterium]|nr:hypothetical protein [Oscillospiraceae bacterium]
MQNTLLMMLQATILLCVTLGTLHLVKFLGSKTEQAKTITENETARRYFDEVGKAVTDAVLHTSQTYVDTLRKSDSFNIENQQEALKRSIDTAKAQLTNGAEEFLATAHGDIAKYLETKIEAEIKARK